MQLRGVFFGNILKHECDLGLAKCFTNTLAKAEG